MLLVVDQMDNLHLDKVLDKQKDKMKMKNNLKKILIKQKV